MPIERLEVADFRNIEAAELLPANRLNLVHGSNASGKTSLMEVLFLLSRAKSYRTAQLRRVIRWGAAHCSVFARCGERNEAGERGAAVGLAVGPRGRTIRINGRTLRSAEELARRVPVVFHHPGSHELVEGSPQVRRSFVNWGAFHVEPSFQPIWFRYQRALKQRNAHLCTRSHSGVESWEGELARRGQEVAELQRGYVRRLEPLLQQYAGHMLGASGAKLSVCHRPGWQGEEDGLAAALARSRGRDASLGYTTCGPHRGDVVLAWAGHPVRDGLSRGQQKLLVVAMSLAQAADFRARLQRPCIMVFDDLPSELDEAHRGRLLEVLAHLGLQVFITTTHRALVDTSYWTCAQVFHVERGRVHSE